MRHLIVPLTKSPHYGGRVGPIERQDWYRGIVNAAKLQRTLPDSKILVVSNVHVAGEEHEVDIYVRTLETLGITYDDIIIIREAQETIEQLEITESLADEELAEIHIISTFLHYYRVRWLAIGMGAKHYAAFGIPRPREAVTDIILTFLFPVLDTLGLREWFMERVVNRRENGKH